MLTDFASSLAIFWYLLDNFSSGVSRYKFFKYLDALIVFSKLYGISGMVSIVLFDCYKKRHVLVFENMSVFKHK